MRSSCAKPNPAAFILWSTSFVVMTRPKLVSRWRRLEAEPSSSVCLSVSASQLGAPRAPRSDSKCPALAGLGELSKATRACHALRDETRDRSFTWCWRFQTFSVFRASCGHFFIKVSLQRGEVQVQGLGASQLPWSEPEKCAACFPNSPMPICARIHRSKSSIYGMLLVPSDHRLRICVRPSASQRTDNIWVSSMPGGGSLTLSMLCIWFNAVGFCAVLAIVSLNFASAPGMQLEKVQRKLLPRPRRYTTSHSAILVLHDPWNVTSKSRYNILS